MKLLKPGLSIMLLLLITFFWTLPQCLAIANFVTLRSCLELLGVNSGNIVGRDTSSSSEYTKLNQQWNIRGGTKYPMAYLVPDNTKEIQHAVNCGRLLKIRVVPKSGGHGYTKYAYGDSNSLVVDLQKLNQVSISKSSMEGTIGAGATLGPVSYQLWNSGSSIIPSGHCPTVGISGLALGGGHGLYARLYGMTTDSILEMEFINAEGQLLITNSRKNSDLFWALRGAGGGSFGIVTKFTFKLYPAPSNLIYANLYFDFTQFPTLFETWQDLLVKSNLTRRVSSYFVIKERTVWLILAHIQHGTSEGTTLMNQIISRFPPPNSMTMTTSFPDFLVSSSALGFHGAIKPSIIVTKPSDLLNLTKVEGGHEYMKSGPSEYIDRILTSAEISKLYTLIGKLVPKGFIFFETYGGAISDKPTDYNSFVHRGNILFNLVVYYEGDVEDKEQLQVMKYFYNQTKLLLHHKESYQNYLDDELVDYLQRYYGKNLNRLVKIKRRVDPDNFFHNPQSIPVTLQR